MARPLGLSITEGRGHIGADPVVAEVVLLHRVDHLRRDQHRHRCALLLVALDVGEQLLGQVRAQRLLELGEILHRVGSLPLRGLPLLLCDVGVPGQPGPVRLDVGPLQGIFERLIARVRVRLAVTGADVRSLRRGFRAHGDTSWASRVRTDGRTDRKADVRRR